MVDIKNTPPGPAIDSSGQTVVDPTANVLRLVEAAIKRQDDLRSQGEKHIKEMQDVQSEHYKELRIAEAERINSIRAVDVGNVQRAAEVQATQALTLATQVTTSAEALRTQVAAAASAQTIALNAALDPIQKRIDDLTRAQYEAQGNKAQSVDSRASNSAIFGYIVGVVGVISTLVAMVILLLGGK